MEGVDLLGDFTDVFPGVAALGVTSRWSLVGVGDLFRLKKLPNAEDTVLPNVFLEVANDSVADEASSDGD